MSVILELGVVKSTPQHLHKGLQRAQTEWGSEWQEMRYWKLKERRFQKDQGERCQTLQRGHMKEVFKVRSGITFSKLLGL